jgi:hypothetical protein
MSVCIIAIFKNEGHIIQEWINHYINQEVDKLFLVDNGSTDNYNISSHLDKIELIKDDKKFAQQEIYNRYVHKYKDYTWAIFCDLDEFIYPRRGFKTIKQYLNRLRHDISLIYIPWKIFGSNGHIQQPSNVVQSFTKRVNYDNPCTIHGVIRYNHKNHSMPKCIVRTKYIKHIKVHTQFTTGGIHITADNNIYKSPMIPNSPGLLNKIVEINESKLNDYYLHINHYMIQSYNWFMAVKATRGDVDKFSAENIRDEKYFKKQDAQSNQLDDYELSFLDSKK